MERIFSPRVERYLATLPGGLDAFPHCQAKGALVRNLLDRAPLEKLLPRLAPPLRHLAEDPPIGSEWLPEVHFAALLLGMADALELTDHELLAWTRERDRALFRSPAYRILMVVASPSRLVRFAGARWGNWHRGTTLEVEGVADESVEVSVRHPPGVFDALLHRVYGQALTAALEVARAPSPMVVVTSESPDHVRYRASWG